MQDDPGSHDVDSMKKTPACPVTATRNTTSIPWTSPENAKLIVRAISDALIEKDPSNASVYRENTQAYLQKLDELDGELKA